MMVVLIVLVLLVLLQPGSSLLLYLRNSTTPIRINSVYSTLGDAPDVPTNYSVAVINKSDITGSCSPLVKLQDQIRGKLVLYNGNIWDNLLFHTCIKNDFALALLFTSWAQDVGAVAVINVARPNDHEYKRGKIAGFNERITIPYIIVDFTFIPYLVDNIASTLYVEISPEIPTDALESEKLANVYNAMVILNSVVHAISLLLLGLIFVMELIFLRTSRKLNYHRMSLVTACFVNSVLLFIWSFVDPFGYKLHLHFPSSSIYLVSVTCSVVIFMLILKIWIKALGESLVKVHVRILLTVVCICVLILVVLAIIVAALWYFYHAVLTLYYFCYVCACCTAVGYIYYGRNLAKVLFKSGNSNTMSRNIISAKIVITAGINSVCIIFILIFYTTGVLGGPFTILVNVFIDCIALFCTFLLLFFKVQKRNKWVQRTRQVRSISTEPLGSDPEQFIN